MTGFDLADHVTELADEMGVVIWEEWEGDCDETPCGGAGTLTLGDDVTPMIFLSDAPVTPEAYLVALHELGHHATWEANEFLRELKAWVWAIEQSLFHLNAEHRALIFRRLETYRD